MTLGACATAEGGDSPDVAKLCRRANCCQEGIIKTVFSVADLTMDNVMIDRVGRAKRSKATLTGEGREPFVAELEDLLKLVDASIGSFMGDTLKTMLAPKVELYPAEAAQAPKWGDCYLDQALAVGAAPRTARSRTWPQRCGGGSSRGRPSAC